MKVCIPVLADQGMSSPACAHFGSAPMFLLVDSEQGTCRSLPNLTHAEGQGHGRCRPMDSFAGVDLDAIIVGGIGPGALRHLQNAGIAVFLSHHSTVGEAVEAHKQGRLPLVMPENACVGHGHHHADEGCGGGHHHADEGCGGGHHHHN